MTDPITLDTPLKLLDADGKSILRGHPWHLPRGGRPGKWMPRLTESRKPRVEGTLNADEGYSWCTVKHLLVWSWCRGCALEKLYVLEPGGIVFEGHDKSISQRARLVRQVTTWHPVNVRLALCRRWQERLEKSVDPPLSRKKLAGELAMLNGRLAVFGPFFEAFNTSNMGAGRYLSKLLDTDRIRNVFLEEINSLEKIAGAEMPDKHWRSNTAAAIDMLIDYISMQDALRNTRAVYTDVQRMREKLDEQVANDLLELLNG